MSLPCASKNRKMEVNTSFIAGLTCGVCLGITIFAIKRFSRPTIPITPVCKTKKDTQVYNDDGGEYKMVLVVRNDLKMGKGKVAAQCAHAAVGACMKAINKDSTALAQWASTGQAKIALKVESEQELMDIMTTAKKYGIITSLITDAGRTQIAPNTKTVLGVGPASKSAIDRVTGHLKLL